MSLHDLRLCACGHPRHQHGRDGYPERKGDQPGCKAKVDGFNARCACKGFAPVHRPLPLEITR